MATTSRPSNRGCPKIPAFVRGREVATSKTIVQCQNYKPLPLRWPFLASLFLIICVLIALLEFAHHVLPSTKYSAGFPLLLPAEQRVVSPAQSTSGRQATIGSRRAVDAIPTTATSKLNPTPTPSPWVFKNSTSLIAINATSLATNGSTFATQAGNDTSNPWIHRFNQKEESPENYAGYDLGFGPTFRYTMRCKGEAGPLGQNRVYSTDNPDILKETPDIGCDKEYTPWYSNDPNDCLYQWIYIMPYGVPPAPPVTPPPPPGMTNSPYDADYYYWTAATIGDCPLPNNCIETCDPRLPVTTTFQIDEVVTTTSGSDGAIATITTNVAVMKTAVGTPGGRVWMLDETLAMTLHTLTDSSGRPTATVAEFLETLTDASGRPTATVAEFLQTLTDASGRPTATVAEYLETLTNSNGVPTETKTVTLTGLFGQPVASLETILGPNGKPIQTLTMTLETLTDSAGRPTATVEGFAATGVITDSHPLATDSPVFPNGTSSIDTTRILLSVPIKPTNYFIASFLPVLMGVLLSTFIQIVDKNLKALLPFHALTKSRGAAATDSLCLIPGGFAGRLHSIRLLFCFGEPISFFCDILVLLAALLVSISSEAIGIVLSGSCNVESFEGCSMYFTVFNGPFRATEGLMIAMAMVIALTGIFLHRLRSGVAFSPWSIASTASLLSEETRQLIQSLRKGSKQNLIATGRIAEQLKGIKFAFEPYFGTRGNIDYGIVPQNSDPSGNTRPGQCANDRLSTIHPKGIQKKSNCRFLPKQSIADHGARAVFLAILCGLFILILYYDTVYLDPKTNSFERFIDSQKFGIRSLFVGFGVVVSFFWDDIFSRVSRLKPYKDLSRLPRRSDAPISASSATTVFPGLWRAIRDRDFFAGTVAFAGILSKFTPLLLSNIPFRVTQTWQTHKVCAGMTIAILAFMIFVLIWTFFVKWPYMPVDPSTIAGNMYYLCDSPVLKDFEGTSLRSEKEWKANLKGIGKDYRFGKMVGLSGQSRIGIYRERALDG